MTPRLRRGAAATALLTGAGVLAGFAGADAASVPVSLSSGSSSRVLHLAAADGSTLDATHGLAVGTGKTASFQATVTDTGYSTTGYQVSSTMTNLYPTSGSAYDFTGAKVASSAISLGTPTSPLDLSGISAKVAPVFTLTGNLTSVLASTIATLPLGTVPSGLNLSSFTTTVTGAPQDVGTATGHLLDGTLASLPLATAGPTGGSYDTPASVGSGDPATGSGATARVILKGTPLSDPTSLLAGVVSALQAQLGSPATTLSALTGSGALDSSSVLAQISSATHIPVSSLPSTASLLGALTQTVTGATGGLLGQSGAYTSNARLDVTVPANLPQATYKGLLTVTLADTPVLS